MPRCSYQRCNKLFCHCSGNTTDEAGFSLLEVIVAMTIFVIVAATAMAAIVSALQGGHTSQQRVDAANIAQAAIAGAIATGPHAAAFVMNGSNTYTASVTNEQFKVTQTTASTPATATACSPGTTVTVSVLVYQQQSGRFLARSDTVIAC
jgi:prepilin-type N-terminal cleavage/methylation domain-containing protein